MADISHIIVNGETLDIKDEVAREGGAIAGYMDGHNSISIKGEKAIFLMLEDELVFTAFRNGDEWEFVSGAAEDMIKVTVDGDISNITPQTNFWYIIFNATIV